MSSALGFTGDNSRPSDRDAPIFRPESDRCRLTGGVRGCARLPRSARPERVWTEFLASSLIKPLSVSKVRATSSGRSKTSTKLRGRESPRTSQMAVPDWVEMDARHLKIGHFAQKVASGFTAELLPRASLSALTPPANRQVALTVRPRALTIRPTHLTIHPRDLNIRP